jgi:hypothetical protein
MGAQIYAFTPGARGCGIIEVWRENMPEYSVKVINPAVVTLLNALAGLKFISLVCRYRILLVDG